VLQTRRAPARLPPFAKASAGELVRAGIAERVAAWDVDEVNGDPERKPCVLLVEDDERLLFAMSEVLNDAGYETKAAGDGHIAINKLAMGWTPDVIVLDIQLPFVGGLEVIQWMREKNLDVPVVLSTQEDDVTAAHVGAVMKLIKPFTLEQLLDAVAICVKAKTRK